MPSTVELQKHFYHPRTHQRLSQAKAKLYARRTGKYIRPQLWLIVRSVVGDTRGLAPEQIASLKKRAGRIEYASRLTRTEGILKLRSVKERHIRRTLGDHRVFQKLFDDFERPGELQRRGAIRLMVNGTVEGRRVKKVIHVEFMKREFEMRYGRPEDAKEGFKDMIVARVLDALRRRGLRVSDPVESAGRVRDLERKRALQVQRLDFEDNAAKRGGIMERIKWHTDAIRQQKQTKQIRGATIRVDKLI